LDAIAAPETVQTPAQSPVMTAQEIEAMIERKAQELSDRRVSGLMSSYDKKLADTNKELARVRKQVLPDEDEPVHGGRGDDRLAALERENAILKAAQRFPKAAPAYLRLLEIEDTEEQIEYLEGLFNPPAAPPVTPVAATPEPVDPTAYVDPNLPANLPNGGVLPTPEGGRFTPESADLYIKQAQRAWEQGRG